MLGSLADLSWFGDNWELLVAGFIVVVGLFVIGAGDVMRFKLSRSWAISGVCFDESIRKRVLWLAPLAIVGVIGITQFQRAIDEQDAVRQSVKVCLFATGLVVILSSIILACTNLPKEIESRVIFTIVTKPTTRLEVILGKVIGFSRISLAIVVIMGLFTWGYMRIAAHQKRQQIGYRLQEGDISDTEKARLTEYQHAGLLAARSYWAPDQLGMYGAPPDPGSSDRIISNSADEDVLAGFQANRGVLFGPPPGGNESDLENWAQGGIGEYGLVVRVTLNAQRTGPSTDQVEPQPGQVFGPTLKPASNPTHLTPPHIGFQILDENYNDLFSPTTMVAGATPAELAQHIAEYSKTLKVDPQQSAANIQLSEPVRLADGTTGQIAYAWLPPKQAISLFNNSSFYVRVYGASNNVDYLIGARPVDCFVPMFKAGQIDFDGSQATRIDPIAGPIGEPEVLAFRGRVGVHLDQEMNGGQDAPHATAGYNFRNVPLADLASGAIPFQINLEVDRSNSDVESGNEDPTRIAVTVIDLATKKQTKLSDPVLVESRLPAFFSIPAGAVTSSNFDVLLHCENSAQTIGLMPDSLQLVTSYEYFEFNLVKSLAIIWMMSILVITLSVLCSTFLSWPIAIVLTLLLLLGHWGVDQLADSSGPGLGRQMVNDFKMTDVAMSKVVSTGVDTLSKALSYLARVLPDTSKFEAIGDIEQGISISSGRLLEALEVLAGFGIPATVLAYVIFLGKEVAP